jgi:hypothetical protein
MAGTDPRPYACCFCGDLIAPQKYDPVEIAIWAPGDQTPQGLFAHLTCLQSRLHKSVPLMMGPALEDPEPR